jgi:hypothetical protein
MNHSTIRPVAVAALALAGLVTPAAGTAQDLPWQAGAGLGFETYHFGDARAAGVSSISLFTLPIAVSSEVGRGVLLEVNTAFASGSLARPDGTSSSLAGLTDTELRASLPIERNGTTFTVTAVGVLPTGRATQSAEEADVAGAIAADLLPFRISNWGSGGGVALAGSVARPVGDFNLGASAGYRVAGEFEPLDEVAFGYRPGNELRLRFAADRNIGEDRKASAHLTIFRYGDDQFEGENLFQSGTRIQLVTSYAFPALGGASAVVYGGVLHRAQGSQLLTGVSGVDPNAPSQTLLLMGSGARMPMGFGTLLPSVDLRLFRREDGVGQGYVISAGAAAERAVAEGAIGGRGLILVPTVRARFGNLMVGEGVSSGFTGAELGFTVRFGDSTR